VGGGRNREWREGKSEIGRKKGRTQNKKVWIKTKILLFTCRQW
jgi:hypothetical protein